MLPWDDEKIVEIPLLFAGYRSKQDGKIYVPIVLVQHYNSWTKTIDDNFSNFREVTVEETRIIQSFIDRHLKKDAVTLFSNDKEHNFLVHILNRFAHIYITPIPKDRIGICPGEWMDEAIRFLYGEPGCHKLKPNGTYKISQQIWLAFYTYNLKDCMYLDGGEYGHSVSITLLPKWHIEIEWIS